MKLEEFNPVSTKIVGCGVRLRAIMLSLMVASCGGHRESVEKARGKGLQGSQTAF